MGGINGFVSNYWYDADGERTVKTSGENEAIYVNSEFSGGNTGTARFSLYVSPYLVAGQGGKYTKHIYVGSQRIVSKLGDLASYGADPRRIPYAGSEADGLTVDYKKKYGEQLQAIKDNYKTFDLPYNGEDNDDYVNGQLCPKDIVGCTREFANEFAFLSLARQFCCNDGTPEAAQAKAMTRAASGNFKPNDEYEKMQFYYHPDHLGSSSYITNLDGEVSQHIEYVPFGEIFIEERNNTWNTPYLFNAKEFDEETGLYYYGARYYEPRLSLWMSTDRYTEKYPFVSPYNAFHNNPLKIIDVGGDSTVVVVSGKGIKRNGHIQYEVSVYRDMSIDQYNDAKENGNLPKADYNMYLARDAHDITAKGKIVEHSSKRYGTNNETPPGTYYLFTRGKAGGSYLLYLGDKDGVRSINGPNGIRAGIAIHQYSPNDSQGCLTTCSGKDITPVLELIKAIPDLQNNKQPVRIILEPREVIKTQYQNPRNGSVKYTGIEHTWNGGTLAPIIVTPQKK